MKSTATLKGCQVLLVRPENASPRILELLREKQAEVFHYPVMSIKYLEPEAIRANLGSAPSPDKMIFTSRNAVEGLANCGNPGEIFAAAPCFAIGISTAETLACLGIQAVTPQSRMTSEGLLELPALVEVEGQTVWLIKGQGGRDHLEEQLLKRGAQVVICQVYRREQEKAYQAEILAFLESAKKPVIFLHSAELMINLLAVVGQQWTREYYQLPIVVPSDRVAGLAREKGFNNVWVAGNAMADNMVSATEEWYSYSQENG